MTVDGIQTVVAVFLKEDRLLMEKRSQERDAYAGFLMCPSGRIETGETRRQALIREMKEELGIQVIDAAFLFNMGDDDPHSGWRFSHNFMLVKSYQGQIKRSYEAKRLEWLTYAQVEKERTAPIVHRLVVKLHDKGLL